MQMILSLCEYATEDDKENKIINKTRIDHMIFLYEAKLGHYLYLASSEITEHW